MPTSPRPNAPAPRLRHIAYLQVIGIILVVLFHSLYYYPDNSRIGEVLLYGLPLSVRMPLFMFVSGYLMVYTTRRESAAPPTAAGFVKGKALRLLLPFMVLSLVTFLPRALLSPIADDAVELSWGNFLRTLYLDPQPPYLWFVQVSFILLSVSYITLRLADRAGLRDGAVYAIFIALMLAVRLFDVRLPAAFSLYQITRLGVFFALGMGYARWQQAVDRLFNWRSTWLAVIMAGAWVGLFFLTEGTRLTLLCSLAGIMMLLSVTRILEKRSHCALDRLVGANYMIFLLSWYCNVVCQQVLYHFLPMPWWIHSLLSLTAGIYIPWLGYRYLRSHPDSRWVRLTAFLLGQRIC